MSRENKNKIRECWQKGPKSTKLRRSRRKGAKGGTESTRTGSKGGKE